MLNRHFLDVPAATGARRVHYRRCGEGAPLLLVHQSPKNGGEYEALMARWSADFTCIAPDTPGFGQSDPLPGDPDIGAFADALLATMDALGLEQTAAYGFHSGAVILMEALRRAPHRFTRTAMGGYAVWTREEMALFGERYLPPFVPQPYGEHLAWLWSRMLEQSWFFPWFAVEDAARLSVAHDDPARVHAAVMDMLDAGDAYRAGYGAVLRAPRAIPAEGPPTLITAYEGDPLQAHLARLGPLPKGWKAHPVASRDAHEAESLAWLRAAPPLPAPPVTEVADEGFVRVDGRLVHWIGHGPTLSLHAPGGEARPVPGMVAVDLPGHGLSDPAREDEDWPAAIAAIAAALGCARVVAAEPGAPLPDLTPTRFGEHLHRAWGVARARRLFAPWDRADAAHAIRIAPHVLDPYAIARDARALLRATGAASYAASLARNPEDA